LVNKKLSPLYFKISCYAFYGSGSILIEQWWSKIFYFKNKKVLNLYTVLIKQIDAPLYHWKYFIPFILFDLSKW